MKYKHLAFLSIIALVGCSNAPSTSEVPIIITTVETTEIVEAESTEEIPPIIIEETKETELQWSYTPTDEELKEIYDRDVSNAYSVLRSMADAESLSLHNKEAFKTLVDPLNQGEKTFMVPSLSGITTYNMFDKQNEILLAVDLTSFETSAKELAKALVNKVEAYDTKAKWVDSFAFIPNVFDVKQKTTIVIGYVENNLFIGFIDTTSTDLLSQRKG